MAKTPRPSKKPILKPAGFAFSCLAFKQAGKTLCMFSCSAKRLESITQVNQRDEDVDDGYQRVVSEQRADKIAEFVDAENYIPTSVLISFTHAKLSEDKTKLIVKNRKDAGWVIDGQHRIIGASRATSDIMLPVVAFTDLELSGQINCFVTINKEARGVSSSLYLELLKNLPGKQNAVEDAKKRGVDLAHLLKVDEESPFYGRIVSTTSPKGGEISLTNFVRKLQPILKINGGALSPYSDEKRCKILNAFYRGLQQVFPAEFKNMSQCIFFKTIGFGVMMGVFPTVLQLTLAKHNGFRVAHAIDTLGAIDDYDFSSWRRMTGSGAESAITEELRTALMSRVGGDGTSLPLELDD